MHNRKWCFVYTWYTNVMYVTRVIPDWIWILLIFYFSQETQLKYKQDYYIILNYVTALCHKMARNVNIYGNCYTVIILYNQLFHSMRVNGGCVFTHDKEVLCLISISRLNCYYYYYAFVKCSITLSGQKPVLWGASNYLRVKAPSIYIM